MRKTTFLGVACAALLLGAAKPPTPTFEDLNAVLWVQTSAEYRANAVQTYRAAEGALLKGLREPHWTAALEQTSGFELLPPAVILDLDETVLDNSPFQARLVTSGKPYTEEEWMKWVEERAAGLVPGAMDFLQFAHAHGVATLYVTNRVCHPLKTDDPTVRLLVDLHVPVEPIEDRLLCAQSPVDKDKTARRSKSAAKYRIVLLVGDEMGDFLQVRSESANLAGRDELFRAHQTLWGTRWFLVPNPMYGSWERALGKDVNDKLSKLKQ